MCVGGGGGGGDCPPTANFMGVCGFPHQLIEKLVKINSPVFPFHCLYPWLFSALASLFPAQECTHNNIIQYRISSFQRFYCHAILKIKIERVSGRFRLVKCISCSLVPRPHFIRLHEGKAEGLVSKVTQSTYRRRSKFASL